MQRNGGSSRLDIDTLPPPSADGGRYVAKAMNPLAIITATAIALSVLGFFRSCIALKADGYIARGVKLFALCCGEAGVIGFFGAFLAATGGLNWLPPTFEFPVGRTSGVIETADGSHVVPHVPFGRVQVYKADWTYVRGWAVNAGGGTFKINNRQDDCIDVITARGDSHFVYTLDGKLISQAKYSPAKYSAFPDHGDSRKVPTSPFLWVFTHPIISWAFIVFGSVVWTITNKLTEKHITKSG